MSQADSSLEAKAEIAAYSKLQKRSLQRAREESSDHPHAVLQTLHKANENLYEKLMDLEVSASERYSECIFLFESQYEELTKGTLETMAAFFSKLRDMEAEYHDKLTNLASEALEKVGENAQSLTPPPSGSSQTTSPLPLHSPIHIHLPPLHSTPLP